MMSTSVSISGRPAPLHLTEFVGRADVIEALNNILENPVSRLVTLTGPAGIGKSRLAAELFRQREGTFSGSIAFVPLAPLDHPDDVLPAIADGIGLWDARGEALLDRITSLIQDQPAILILDNFEHVVSAAPAVGELLTACPELTVLATSRVPLHVQGEREYAVPHLGLIDHTSSATPEEPAANEAVQLFVRRAQSVNRHFPVDEDSLRLVARICSRLEGLPLAIELAAARTKVLPLPALYDRLENQLQLLRSDTRDLPPRLRTMNSAIAWSYDLLSDHERRLFRLLSVFTTTFDLRDAAALAGVDELEALDGVFSLLDKSMLSLRAPDAQQPTYRMLQVMRQFGHKELEGEGELELARNRHAKYFADMAERAFADYFDVGQTESVTGLEPYHDDFRAALSWSLSSGDFSTAAKLGKSLWVFWHLRCHLVEGRRWLDQILAEEPSLPSESVPFLLFGAGVLATSQRDFDEVTNLALRLCAMGEETDDIFVLGFGHYLTGAAIGHETPEARTRYSRAAEALHESGNENWVWYASSQVGLSALEAGDLEGALKHTSEAYELCRRVRHSWAIALIGSYLGRVYRHLGRPNEALEYFKEALTLARQTGDRILTPTLLEHMAGLSATGGQPEIAARLFGYSNLARETRSFPTKPVDLTIHNEAIAAARSQLGEQAFKTAWTDGRTSSLDAIVSEALQIEINRDPTPVPPPSDKIKLTRREREVLQRIVQGYTDQEIADDLYVSYRTVTTHVTNILNKLGANSRTEAAAIAVRTGIVPE